MKPQFMEHLHEKQFSVHHACDNSNTIMPLLNPVAPPVLPQDLTLPITGQ
jgi:hypothetical protein